MSRTRLCRKIEDMAYNGGARSRDKGGNNKSLSPVHVYQEIVGYSKPKSEKGRSENLLRLYVQCVPYRAGWRLLGFNVILLSQYIT